MKRKILLQLDGDAHASIFDRVVAVDAGVDELFSCSQVQPEQVVGLVHGAIFTRGVPDLQHTAVFVGGSDVRHGEALFQQVKSTFFGPMRVSVMFDANGCNTTAAAAVLCAGKHLDLRQTTAAVLGGTGPVGQRVAKLLATAGANVRVISRWLDRAQAAVANVGHDHVTAVAADTPQLTSKALEGCQLVIAAGAAGVALLPAAVRQERRELQVAIDLNAVPPAGIEGIAVMDKGAKLDQLTLYGAIGVGGLKMKIHKAALAQLFTRNDLVLDAQEIYDLGQTLL